jgi:ribosomal protein S18 acetylase RimI-like enzyme
MQVFLDTYAPEGVRPDLAREALEVCSPSAFAKRLAAAGRIFTLAVQGEHLVGFAELSVQLTQPPGLEQTGAELIRLYIQPAAQRRGVGAQLLRRSEAQAAAAGAQWLWLTAWVGNRRALDFYQAQGFEDAGATEYVFEDRSYENRVLVKPLAGRAPV